MTEDDVQFDDWMKRPPGDPTPRDIEQSCLEIRDTWPNPRQRVRLAGKMAQSLGKLIRAALLRRRNDKQQ